MNRVLFASIIVGITVMLSASTIPTSYGGGLGVIVPVDIKPQSCPNPLNVNSQGVLPVAILGTDTIDVFDIDVSTILLEGVSPIRDEIEDVATPFEPFFFKEDALDCTEEGPDGFVDLTLKFSTQAIVAAWDEPSDGEVIVLTLTGNFNDGTPLLGEDVVIIISKN